MKLFPWDAVAAQMLEPFGESSCDGMSLESLWAAAAKGNKTAQYHSHLCASQSQDPWHVGAGISLTAAVLLAAIKHFHNDDMKHLLKPEFDQKIEQEVQNLEPILKVLNLGKKAARPSGTPDHSELSRNTKQDLQRRAELVPRRSRWRHPQETSTRG